MDSRTLVEQLLAPAGNPSRVGSFEHFWSETPHVWLPQGYPVASSKPVLASAEPAYVKVSHVFPSEVQESGSAAPESPYHVFDYDMHPCGGGFDTEPLAGHEEILQETEEWVVKRNGAGATFKYWRHKSGTPEHMDFRMTGREIWERDYRPYLLQLNRDRLRGGAIKGSTLDEDRAKKNMPGSTASGRATAICSSGRPSWEPGRRLHVREPDPGPGLDPGLQPRVHGLLQGAFHRAV